MTLTRLACDRAGTENRPALVLLRCSDQRTIRRSLPPTGLLHVRLVGAGQPVRSRQTLVDRLLASPQRVDVATIGGEAGRDLGTLGNGAVAGDDDIDVPGGLSQPVECRLVGAD